MIILHWTVVTTFNNNDTKSQENHKFRFVIANEKHLNKNTGKFLVQCELEQFKNINSLCACKRNSQYAPHIRLVERYDANVTERKTEIKTRKSYRKWEKRGKVEKQ